MRFPIGMNLLQPAVLFGALVFLAIISILIALKKASINPEEVAIARSRYKRDPREKAEKWVRNRDDSSIFYRFKG